MLLRNTWSSSIFHKCRTVKQFKETHTQLLIRGLNHRSSSLRPIISFSSLDPFGDINYALLLLLFRTTVPSSLFLFNTVIRGLARCHGSSHFGSASLLVLGRMSELNLSPNNFTFTFLFQGCSNRLELDLGRQFHGVSVKSSLENDVFVRNSMIQFYSLCRKVEEARRVFDESRGLDTVSWNSMIGGYFENGRVLNALRMFDAMPQRNDVSWNSALGGLVKYGYWDDAYRVFTEMPRRNLVSWVVMISGCAQNGRPKEALALCRDMLKLSSDQRPNSAILVSVLSACSQLGALDIGNWVYAYIRKRRLSIDSILSAALIDMYAKCGQIELAMQVFSASADKCVSTHTAAISGLAMNGRSNEALWVFDQMTAQGISPDGISYIAVLTACSHEGWVDEAFRYFDSMWDVYGIRPELDHYACMVDLLGRAGLLEEAESFVGSLPVEPDSAVWGALLGACRVHGNAEMGRRVGNLLIQSDRCHDGRYVVLSNIYAESMRGVEAQEIRKAMRKRRVARVPGFSLIEVDGLVREFLAGDRSHEKTEEIYSAWDEIVKEIRKFGYVAETRGVGFDVEDEEKETLVGYHSEKLALAFGFICTKPGSVIRIVKNIRMCNDCHSAFKLVSKVFERKISVRDRKRFHHFEEGHCSCKDYW